VTTTAQNALFESWLAQHAAILHHVAHGFADGADRQDLLQELLLALWQAVPAFRGGAQPATFIYRVAHNAALTWRRTARNYRQRVDRFATLDLPFTTHLTGAPRDQEALEHVYAAIRGLPPLDRSLILLHLDGVSYAEMASPKPTRGRGSRD
jgi:RNA polymerase sigma-70 factor (ECF subfamily)